MQDMASYGAIEVDLFEKDVNSLDHPEVVKFKTLLEDVAQEYNCNLLFLHVEHGTVTFSFDSEELMAEIVKILQSK